MPVGLQRQHFIERAVGAARRAGVDFGLARGGNDHERGAPRPGGQYA